ncbi:MAG: GLUG motif-containing protein [Bacillota bacterium]|nr:GLUG motif-containing protein [Bacillota bacterium]
MKSRMKITLSRSAALILVFALVLAAVQPAAEVFAENASSTVHISSAEDLREFAVKCSLDTWSQGKKIILDNDIDLRGEEFTPIPTFGGTFDGGGHMISGLNIVNAGSVQGLFRYIQKNAEVRNLNVKGNIEPSGSKNKAGGIAGSNSGTIINCTFYGDVSGKYCIGGIAGTNTEDGTVSGCSVEGTVLGEKGTGGICGENSGLIQKCENDASVNNRETAGGPGQDSSDSLIDRLTSPAEEDLERVLDNTVSDTGGIAGYSGGIIQNCTNRGKIGFEHTGYNVGGIAGRQNGFITGCENSGLVLGRKDVGGIAGQMEPYILINAASDSLSQMRTELNTMQSMIDKMLTDMDNTSSRVSGYLDAVSGYADTARDSSQDLINRVSEFIDANVEEVNDLSSIISDTADRMVPVMDDAQEASEKISKSLKILEKALDEIEAAGENAGSGLSSLKKAVQEAEKANQKVIAAFDKISSALESLSDAVYRSSGDDRDAASSVALKELSSALQELSGAVNEVNSRAAVIEQITSDESTGGITEDTDFNQAVRDAASAVKVYCSRINDTVSAGTYGFADAIKGFSLDWEKVQQALSELMSAAGDMKEAAEQISDAMNYLKNAADDFQTANEHLMKASELLGDFSHSMSRAFDSLASCCRGFKEIGEYLSEQEPVEFVKLGEEFRQSSDSLFDAMTEISGLMSLLENEISSSSDVLIQDLRNINSKFNDIMQLLINTVENLRDGTGDGIEQYLEDTSDRDISATRLGKVISCENKGAVEADRNTGGIAGTIAIEFDFDPEEDIFDGNPLNTKFETKAVLQNCINRGTIKGRKDCTGGAAGRMDLGTIVLCENYGEVSSYSGDYAGGIAGFSDGVIRSCYAKCSVSGENYVGGIAGSGSKIINCCSIIEIDRGTEYVGSVAGYADVKESELQGNLFVSEETAGVDGISYSGKAEPAEYSTLALKDGIPEEFKSFRLTFTADDEVVKVIPVVYGERLSAAELPDIPEKEGCYGVWPEKSKEAVLTDRVIEAEYHKYLTAAASEETFEGGRKSIALAEGSFTDEVKLSAAESSAGKPDISAAYENVYVWDINLSNSDTGKDDPVPLRLLNADGGGARVWEYKNGEWKEIEADVKGQYLCVEMTGTKGTFCVASTGTNPVWRKILTGAVLLVLLLSVILIIVKKRKERRKKTDSQT